MDCVQYFDVPFPALFLTYFIEAVLRKGRMQLTNVMSIGTHYNFPKGSRGKQSEKNENQ